METGKIELATDGNQMVLVEIHKLWVALNSLKKEVRALRQASACPPKED